MRDHAEEYGSHLRIEKLREMVDNKDYIDEAIHRIAQVLSNEITINREGAHHER